MIDLLSKQSYNYNLPPELVAQFPADKRDASRLLHLNKATGAITHGQFTDLPGYLQPGDLLVLNRTKVIPARLLGTRASGAPAEIFLVEEQEPDCWKCLVKPGRRLQAGAKVQIGPGFEAIIEDLLEDGARLVRLNYQGDFWGNLEKYGHTPLPPYINRQDKPADRNTYQTVYAKENGSVAAPTAGLHFTDDMLELLAKQSIEFAEVVLHVGPGTFKPVKTDDIRKHIMHWEYCQINEENANAVNKAKAEGRRVIAVGTTTTRTLESFWADGLVQAGSHRTNLFIYPGRYVNVIDGLLTNFHMPQSTLLMLVCALGGYQPIMQAYNQAVQKRYRFFSYGDAMLIL